LRSVETEAEDPALAEEVRLEFFPVVVGKGEAAALGNGSAEARSVLDVIEP
jgi:hypothetical protein